jgi:hypothetical protein
MKTTCLFLLMSLTLPSIPARGATIWYEASRIGDGLWQYDYTVYNDAPAYFITEFNVTFEPLLYAVLTTPEISSSNWKQYVSEPSVNPSASGYYWALAPGECGIGPQSVEDGFSVSFLWLGDMDPPGEQWFDVTYASSGETKSGLTTPASPVPEPGTLILLASGILALAGYRGRSGR